MIERHHPTAIYHGVVEHAGVLHLAGVVADDLGAGMSGQAGQVFAKIDALLEAHGSDREHVLSALIFVTDIALKAEMNPAWQRWIPAGALPARATIGVADLGEGVLIEVVVTAAVRKGGARGA